jgi:hypothetical protein
MIPPFLHYLLYDFPPSIPKKISRDPKNFEPDEVWE